MMDWLAFASGIINRIPIERVLFPPPDHTKALEDFRDSIGGKGVESPEAAFKRIYGAGNKGTSALTEAELRDKVRGMYRQLDELRGLVESGAVSKEQLTALIREEKPE